MLEHGVRLDLVQRCFEEALLLELVIVIVVIDTAELLSLFVQELKVSSALVLDLLFIGLVVPVGFLFPFLVFLVVLVLVGEVKVVFLLGLLAVLEGGRQGLEQSHNTLQQTWPSLLNTNRNTLGVQGEKCTYSRDAQLLVMNSRKVVDAGEPQAEELVCPTIGLEDVESKGRVVVDTVDDDLHQMDAEGLDLGLIVSQHLHSKPKELWDIVVDVTAHVEHDDLGKLASADAVNTSDLVVLEDGANHVDHSVKVSPVLDKGLSSVVDEVLQSRQHV